MAGFLYVLSHEVSALLICLLTVDRYITLRCPHSILNSSKWSAHLANLLAWVVGLVLAAIPLLPLATSWRFYGNTGMCIPLPGGSEALKYPYAFILFSAVKMAQFSAVAMAQLVIYLTIRNKR